MMMDIVFYGNSIVDVYQSKSLEELIIYFQENTYKNNKEYLDNIHCDISDDILKTYREASCFDIEKEMVI